MDQTRRQVLLTGSAGAGWLLAGRRRAAAQAALPIPIIDAHAHVFNGRDIPVVGFLKQVVLRDAQAAPTGGGLTNAALKLLSFILLSDTPSPAEELAELAGAPPVRSRLMMPAAEDQRAVAEGIARYRAELGRQTDGLSTTRAEEEALLDQIEADLGLTPSPAPQGLSTGPGRSDDLAARIFAAPEAAAAGLFRDSRLLQTIRWAGMLTRRRGEMLDRLVSLYGGDGRTRVFVPALVDFALWFTVREPKPVSDIRDQIAVMSALARRRTDAVILNIAPFCPLRAVLDRRAGRDPLATLKWAVGEMGFAGVKLYPPLGFAPEANADLPAGTVPAGPVSGVKLDGALAALYEWCAREDVPVMAHANNSNDAGLCSGLNASPARWRPVLARHRLRLNLAHFGGFSEQAAAFCTDPVGIDWERHAVANMVAAPGAYADIGYWTEGAVPGNPRRAEVIGKLAALATEFPVLKQRLIYGSDWSMLGREPRHEAYLEMTAQALTEAGFDADARMAVMGGNARRFLGLDGATAQRDRLARFFGPGHAFHALFPA